MDEKDARPRFHVRRNLKRIAAVDDTFKTSNTSPFPRGSGAAAVTGPIRRPRSSPSPTEIVDKANLMRTMLKIAGVPSYLVAIYSGARTHVRDAWPSPWQFNHMILAVKVSPQTVAPSVIEHPQFGRLMIFDPTDEMTPPGYLPEYEQDSLALVLAGDSGALLRMPVTPPSANRVEREAEVTLDAEGSISPRRGSTVTASARPMRAALSRTTAGPTT